MNPCPRLPRRADGSDQATSAKRLSRSYRNGRWRGPLPAAPAPLRASSFRVTPGAVSTASAKPSRSAARSTRCCGCSAGSRTVAALGGSSWARPRASECASPSHPGNDHHARPPRRPPRSHASRGTDLHEREDILSTPICARDEHGNGLTDREPAMNSITLLFAGHETPPRCSPRRCTNWRATRPARNGSSAQGSPYADALVAENLRLRPPVPLLARRRTRTLRLAGDDLPAGVNLCPAPCSASCTPMPTQNLWAFQPAGRFPRGAACPGARFPFVPGFAAASARPSRSSRRASP